MQDARIDPTPEEGRELDGPPCVYCGAPADFTGRTPVCELCDSTEREQAEIVVADGRRCPAHPHVTISSPDGMFDGLCNLCESEQARQEELEEDRGFRERRGLL